MCMYVSAYAKPRKARKDIECFKVVLLRIGSAGLRHIMTPCQSTCLSPDVISGHVNFVARKYCFDDDKHYSPNGIYISRGFIHTFRRLKDAESFKNRLYVNGKPLIYKCVIPAGTEYYKGEDESIECPAYASDAIRFVKKIELE